MKTLSITEKKPFTIVEAEDEKTNERKAFVAIGKFRLPNEYKNYEEAEKAIKRKDWEIISLLIEAFVDYLTKNKE